MYDTIRNNERTEAQLISGMGYMKQMNLIFVGIVVDYISFGAVDAIK